MKSRSRSPDGRFCKLTSLPPTFLPRRPTFRKEKVSSLVLGGSVLLVLIVVSMFNQVSAQPMILVVTGTIQPGVEAGCWLIRDDASNKEYLLLDAPSALQIDGLHAQITGYMRTDIASYCMQGEGALQIISYSVVGSETTISVGTVCTTTWTHTGGYLPVPFGVCQEITAQSPNPILNLLTDFWSWLRSLVCRFGYCT
jgi:hypothetical protein